MVSGEGGQSFTDKACVKGTDSTGDPVSGCDTASVTIQDVTPTAAVTKTVLASSLVTDHVPRWSELRGGKTLHPGRYCRLTRLMPGVSQERQMRDIMQTCRSGRDGVARSVLRRFFARGVKASMQIGRASCRERVEN